MSHKDLINHVETELVQVKNHLMPAKNTLFNDHSKKWKMFPQQPSVSTTVLNSASNEIKYNVEKHSAHKLKNLRVRYKLSASGGDVVVSTPDKWFSRVELWANQGNTLIWRSYPETLVFDKLACLEPDECKEVLESEGYNSCNVWPDKKKLTVEDGSSVQLWFNIKCPLFDQGINLQNISQDIVLKFTTSGKTVVSGTASHLSLDRVEYFFDEVFMESHDLVYESKLSNQFNTIYPYLQPIDVSQTSTLTDGSETTIYLDQVVGNVAGFLICVRESTVATDNAQYKYDNLGDDNYDASISLKDESGNSFISSDTVPIGQVRNDCVKHLKSGSLSKNTGYYLLPLSEDFSQACHGVKNGFHTIAAQKHSIRFTPKSLVPRRETLTYSATANAGSLSYIIPSVGISGDQAYDETKTNVKADLDDLFGDVGYVSTTVSAAPSDTHYIDFNDPHCVYRPNNPLGLAHDVNASGTKSLVTPSLTNYGRKGLVSSGSSYQINIYAYVHKEFQLQTNGLFTEPYNA